MLLASSFRDTHIIFGARRLLILSGPILVVMGFLSAIFAVVEPAYSQAARSPDRPPSISDQGGTIPVKVVDGRVVVSCDISGPNVRVPVNLWLDFDGAYGLQLHDNAAQALPAETAGRSNLLGIHFPDFSLEVASRKSGPQAEFEEFTKYFSAEIGENALVGAIGAHVLKHFDVILDLHNGQIELLPPGQLAELQETLATDVPDEVVVPITLQNNLAWLPVQIKGPEGELKRALAIGSSQYDTRIDSRLCNSLQRPAGDVGPVMCKTVDFAPYIAFRPSEVTQAHADGVAGVIGINLLEQFRIHIDHQSLLATVRPVKSPEFPQQDLEYFRAMVAKDSDLVLKWLDKSSESRLGQEAAELLLTLLLDEGAEADKLATAIQWIDTTTPPDLRATRARKLMEDLVNIGKTELGIMAGEIGIKSARQDRYPKSSYKLHARLGELLLPTNKREAWRHLLSAAFGLPEDGMVNLNLGRVYEANNKKKRAFSRYIQALLKEESSELAMAALMRMEADLPEDQRLTIETIDRMTSGRVRNFSAPEKYVVDPETKTNRTCLVEFFTNAYRKPAIGGALGNQGIISHFDKTECVCLSYHLPNPRSEPLVTPLGQFMASWLKVRSPVVQTVDGVGRVTGTGRHTDAEIIFKTARKQVVERLQEASPVTISGKTKLAGKAISGEITVQVAPIDSDADSNLKPLMVQVVVAERGVVFHGSSGVIIHRMLARGLATDGLLNGVEFSPDDKGKFVLSIDRNLADIEKENSDYLSSLENGNLKAGMRMGMQIDPRSVEIIVVVRDANTGEVIQTHQCDVQREVAK